MSTDIITPGETTVKNLAACYGIQPDWKDIWGNVHAVSDEAFKALLNSMGISSDSPQQIAEAIAHRCKAEKDYTIEPVMVVTEEAENIRIPVYLKPEDHDKTFRWQLIEESGNVREGEFHREGTEAGQLELLLDPMPLLGYHRFVMRDDATSHEMLLVVSPTHCFLPPALRDELENGEPNLANKTWGPALQLYAVRSKRNWGMGDFTDLLNTVDWCAKEGAGMVGLNPIHALFPHNPRHSSPYSPSSRAFFNVLYLDAEAIEDFAESETARQRVHSPDFQKELARLREEELVDYETVGRLKMEIYRLLYRNFGQKHLAKNTARGNDFKQFVEKGGERLQRFALYHALQERFFEEDNHMWGWPVWPESYRDPDGKAVAEFVAANPERIGFYQYLQWQVDIQLSKVGKRAFDEQLGVGLYLDMAVGVDWGGADVWGYQHLFAKKCGVGAPPDEYNQKGQDWGLPPMIPDRMREEQFASFIQTLQHNMKHAGALRMDHVMGLMRLFWIPPGLPPSAGAYVHYPFDEILGILALESQRNQCMVIGEDMGTVPEIVQDRMIKWGIYSYKVFYFEKEDAEKYIAPEKYIPHAAVAVSTHDLPTLAGFWQSEDIAIRTELDLYPSNELRDKQIKERVMERLGILKLLEQEGLLPEGVIPDPVATSIMTPELARAIHQLVARTPCKVHMVQLEDMLQQPYQINLPGTVEPAYPNWQRRITMPLEDLLTEPRVQATLEGLKVERPRWVAPDSDQKKTANPVGLKIPRATYRFQFNKSFTFNDAAKLVPYLAKLGISHCYASPLLQAREGSQHGYDITNHKILNKEIGTREEFDQFTDTLKAHGMGLILDIVPNHMGSGKDNPWWMDVLENGQASLYSDYFDIDWYPLSEPLQGKILHPILGNAYGKILESGEFKIAFSEATGKFVLNYYEHPLPINPASYPVLMGHRLDVLEARIGADNPAFLEYQSIVTSYENLPQLEVGENEIPLAAKEDRAREVSVATNRLINLCKTHPEVMEFITENLHDFQGETDKTNVMRLHRLLEQQAYRLANWRVASDEINFRRFFDINDLVALRVEDQRVFSDTHELILELIENGQIQGLRIDHPDGLFDPSEYFKRLQAEAGKRLGADTSGPLTLSSEKLPFYIAIEKILAPFERLPDEWTVHGTTGYEFANSVNGILINTAAEKDFTKLYEKWLGEPVNFVELVHHCKMLIMNTTLNSEMSVLAYQLDRISEQNWSYRDFTLHNLRTALMEVVACFPVYRAYVTPDGQSDKDREYIDWAISRAKKRSPVTDASIFDFIRETLLLQLAQESENARKAVVRFAMKFQQYSGPVMAKGLEDTSFYRYNRLVSLNEVGGEPHEFGLPLQKFHTQNLERQKRAPHTLLATSTHDTKRAEDTRARISVLSEMPSEWQKHVTQWRRLNRSARKKIDKEDAPTPNAEYLFYQSLVGVWPFKSPDAAELESLADRLDAYMLKAVKEAKNHTSWINPNQPYEAALSHFVRAVLKPSNKPFLDDFEAFHHRVARLGIFNSLSQTLLKLTVSGVPDVYQGTETWDFSLVDPDNRRPVDYQRLQQQLDTLEHEEDFAALTSQMLDNLEDGRFKQFLIASILQFRKQVPQLFMEGEYIPLEVTGSAAEHIVAFARVWKGTGILVVAPRLLHLLGLGKSELPQGRSVWKNTAVVLPASLAGKKITNVLTHQAVNSPLNGTEVPVAELLSDLPVGFLTLR